MLKKNCLGLKKSSIFLSISFVLFFLTGCRTIQEKILDNLEDLYGTKFEMESFTNVGAVYEPICYPVDDPSLLFLGVFDKTGEIVSDGYISTLIGKENSIFLQECIGDELGESFISRGIGTHMLEYNSEESGPILDLFTNDDYSSEQVYEILRDMKSEYTESYYFIILINSSKNSNFEYGQEYDVLKNASEELIKKYNDDYKIEVGINYILYFVEDEEYANAKEALEHFHPRINTFDKYLNGDNSICFATDNNTSNCVWATILSKDEYINERMNMR